MEYLEYYAKLCLANESERSNFVCNKSCIYVFSKCVVCEAEFFTVVKRLCNPHLVFFLDEYLW